MVNVCVETLLFDFWSLLWQFIIGTSFSLFVKDGAGFGLSDTAVVAGIEMASVFEDEDFDISILKLTEVKGLV